MTQLMTGYDTHDRFYASRYLQGQRTVYSIDLSLAQVAALLPKPDPNKPTPGNRRVKEAHAKSFGKYVREQTRWVAPALLLRSAEIYEFETQITVSGTEFGILGVPRLARTDLRILDGQHRILGLHLAVEELANQIEETRNKLAVARRDDNREVIPHYQAQLEGLEALRRRYNTERISVEIHIADDQKDYMQMFVDIADNALGITSAIRARFDDRKVVNRALDDALHHVLLRERVDLEQDRIGAVSPYLMGAKHVADIIRTLTVGLGGRVGRRQEDELREAALVEASNGYFDLLIAAFPDMEKLVNGEIVPEQLRRASLLGSTTMLRVLAGVYHNLIRDYSDGEIEEFFSALAPFMSAPLKKDSPWLKSTTVFAEGALAPRARNQDMEMLVKDITGWMSLPPLWLKAKTTASAK